MHVTYAYLHRAAEASAAIAPSHCLSPACSLDPEPPGSVTPRRRNSCDISASNHHEDPDVIRAVIDEQQDHVVVFWRSTTFSSARYRDTNHEHWYRGPYSLHPQCCQSPPCYTKAGVDEETPGNHRIPDFLSSFSWSSCRTASRGC
jgi:hypothetical protein